MILLTPLMHHFNVNDNLIILLSSVSGIAGQLMRAFAKNPTVFYASVAVELASNMFSPPIRAQMTRCILPEETGKVNTLIFTSVYQFTSLYLVANFVGIRYVGKFRMLCTYSFSHIIH